MRTLFYLRLEGNRRNDANLARKRGSKGKARSAQMNNSVTAIVRNGHHTRL